MVRDITKNMKWKVVESFDCRHNYIDMEGNTPVLRKGAISAKDNERVVIPLNMRDGVIIGRGLGNEDWNLTAPHGAGRVLNKTEVKNRYTVTEYKKAMEGIYSPSIGSETLEEAPFAYRSPSIIEDAIKDSVKIESILKPVYNFKANKNESKQHGFKRMNDKKKSNVRPRNADRKRYRRQ